MENEYKIEKGIPIPPMGESAGTVITTVLKKMKVGDSFVANHPPGTFYAAARYNGMKVSVRKIEGGGFRVWRVK